MQWWMQAAVRSYGGSTQTAKAWLDETSINENNLGESPIIASICEEEPGIHGNIFDKYK